MTTAGEPGTDSVVGYVRPDAAPVTATVSIPPDAVHLPLVRSIAAAVGAACDFDLDTIADLRMATDELASILVTRAAAQAPVTVSWTGGEDVITVTGSVTPSEPLPVDDTSFGWAVLTALVRQASADIEARDDGHVRLRITVDLVQDRGGQ